MTWVSKNRYVVIDVSAGPSAFGPLGHDASGTVTPLSVPRLQVRASILPLPDPCWP